MLLLATSSDADSPSGKFNTVDTLFPLVGDAPPNAVASNPRPNTHRRPPSNTDHTLSLNRAESSYRKSRQLITILCHADTLFDIPPSSLSILPNPAPADSIPDRPHPLRSATALESLGPEKGSQQRLYHPNSEGVWRLLSHLFNQVPFDQLQLLIHEKTGVRHLLDFRPRKPLAERGFPITRWDDNGRRHTSFLPQNRFIQRRYLLYNRRNEEFSHAPPIGQGRCRRRRDRAACRFRNN